MLSLPLWTFTGYHVALVCSGHTTKEHIKGRKHGARKLALTYPYPYPYSYSYPHPYP